MLPQEIEEEERDEIDWGADEEVLAPLQLCKPQVKLACGGEPSSAIGACPSEDGEKETWIVGGVRIKGKSTFWNTPPGELPNIQQGRTRGQQGGAGGSSYAMITTVYMVETGQVNYKAAMETAEAEQWQAAVDSKCSSVVKNKVLMFVDSIPTGKRAILTKLIRQLKLGSVGVTVRFKARLVARGFRQVEGFAEMFAPVASLSSVRIVLVIARMCRYVLHQMDVVTAFLGSKLDQEIYVHLLLGVLRGPRVGRLNRSLYGLKQSP